MTLDDIVEYKRVLALLPVYEKRQYDDLFKFHPDEFFASVKRFVAKRDALRVGGDVADSVIQDEMVIQKDFVSQLDSFSTI